MLGALVLVAAVAGLVGARGDLTDSEVRGEAAAADRAAAASARREVEAVEAATERRLADAQALAGQAADAREVQRQRLRDLGLTELTVDRFLEQVRANTELVEWQRDETTAEVDRQAQQIPDLERCMTAARQAINTAFNRSIDPNVVVPTPTEVCLALLVAEP